MWFAWIWQVGNSAAPQAIMKMKTQSNLVRVSIILFLIVPLAMAADWPQIRGANQDGISTEKISVWPPEGPKLVWRVPLTQGYSSFAVCGDKVFTLIRRGEVKGQLQELCVALDAATGKEIWASEIESGVKYLTETGTDSKGRTFGDGPRSTPAVGDGKVYVYSHGAKVCCLDAQTGKEVWRVDVLKDHGGEGRVPKWGNSSSPVLDRDLVIVAGGGPGESILGINKNTGKVVWKTGDLLNSQGTPVVTSIHGERQVVFCLKNSIAGISVKDGKILWEGPWKGPICAPHPIVCEDKAYFCAGNWGGVGLYRIVKETDGFHAKNIWEKGSQSSPWFNTPIFWGGHLYGTFGMKTAVKFKCIEFATGKDKWASESDKFGRSGGSILIGDKLLVLSEYGDIVLVDPKPDAYKEIARFKAIDGGCYATPAFSNGRLYIRSIEEGACYDLSAK